MGLVVRYVCISSFSIEQNKIPSSLSWEYLTCFGFLCRKHYLFVLVL